MPLREKIQPNTGINSNIIPVYNYLYLARIVGRLKNSSHRITKTYALGESRALGKTAPNPRSVKTFCCRGMVLINSFPYSLIWNISQGSNIDIFIFTRSSGKLIPNFPLVV